MKNIMNIQLRRPNCFENVPKRTLSQYWTQKPINCAPAALSDFMLFSADFTLINVAVTLAASTWFFKGFLGLFVLSFEFGCRMYDCHLDSSC